LDDNHDNPFADATPNDEYMPAHDKDRDHQLDAPACAAYCSYKEFIKYSGGLLLKKVDKDVNPQQSSSSTNINHIGSLKTIQLQK